MIESRFACPMLLLALAVSPAAAQETVHSFDELHSRVATGDTVIVTDVHGRRLHGTLRELSASTITITVKGTETALHAADVHTIGRRDSRWNGTLWGMAIGGTLGTLVDRGLVDEYGREDISTAESAAFIAWSAAAGAGVGFVADALIRGQHLLYSRPAASVRRTPVVIPIWLGMRKGVFLSVRVQ